MAHPGMERSKQRPDRQVRDERGPTLEESPWPPDGDGWLAAQVGRSVVPGPLASVGIG